MTLYKIAPCLLAPHFFKCLPKRAKSCIYSAVQSFLYKDPVHSPDSTQYTIQNLFLMNLFCEQQLWYITNNFSRKKTVKSFSLKVLKLYLYCKKYINVHSTYKDFGSRSGIFLTGSETELINSRLPRTSSLWERLMGLYLRLYVQEYSPIYPTYII